MQSRPQRILISRKMMTMMNIVTGLKRIPRTTSVTYLIEAGPKMRVKMIPMANSIKSILSLLLAGCLIGGLRNPGCSSACILCDTPSLCRQGKDFFEAGARRRGPEFALARGRSGNGQLYTKLFS